jgi:hypothetical protein
MMCAHALTIDPSGITIQMICERYGLAGSLEAIIATLEMWLFRGQPAELKLVEVLVIMELEFVVSEWYGVALGAVETFDKKREIFALGRIDKPIDVSARTSPSPPLA